MLFTVVKKNTYQDSINLMLLTNRINTLEGVKQSQIMMATDANKDIYRNAGLLTAEAEAAAPGDMCIVVEADSEDIVDKVLEEVKAFLNDMSVKKEKQALTSVTTWDEALEQMQIWHYFPRRASILRLRSRQLWTKDCMYFPSPIIFHWKMRSV